MARDCTKEKKSSDMDDVNSLAIGMVQIEEIEVSHVAEEGFVEMLGDTGAQGHVSPPYGDTLRWQTVPSPRFTRKTT